MILPIQTSITPRRTPYANYALIAINAVIFLATYMGGQGEALRPWARAFVLVPVRPEVWQFVSYAFLHNGIWHIAGNMFFLYIFGNNVNDRMGNVGYVCFYLAGAVFSGIGHVLLSSSPVLGASGAVAAVTGAYLVLFPQTLITVVYFFFFIGTIEVPAIYLIALKMILIDNLFFTSGEAVAYDAHLSGYGFGIFSMLLMLWVGILSPSQYDLLAMIKRWNQRRRYRDVVSDGYDPFSPGPMSKKIKVKEVKKSVEEERREEEIYKLRAEITNRIGQRNLSEASKLYLELIEADDRQVLPRQQLLDIANQLAGESRYNEAAGAYEKFLSHYGNYEYVEQVELMVGILYSRYLANNEAAIKHLESAQKRLSDEGQKQMCNEELGRLMS